MKKLFLSLSLILSLAPLGASDASQGSEASQEDAAYLLNPTIQSGIDVSAIEQHGNPILIAAASNDDLEMVQAFLASGAGIVVNATNQDGNTALIMAQQLRDQDIVEEIHAYSNNQAHH